MGLAHAATSSSTNQEGIVDKIAAKFNLNKADVQKVFDEDRTAHQAQHQQKMKERLDQAVKDGKLTQAQEDKLIAKQKELEASRQANRDAMKDKTKAERKTAIDADRTAFKQWLTDNGIPAEYDMMGGRGGMRGQDGPSDTN
jgi:hypothetical protein